MTPAHDLSGPRTAVYLATPDPISSAGLAAQLRGQPGIHLVDELAGAHLAVLLVDSVDEDALGAVKRLRGDADRQIVMIVTTLDGAGMLRAVESGASAILRRAEVTVHKLAEVVDSARKGHGTIPSDLLGSLLVQVGELQRNVLQPRGMLFNGFTEREIEVLRLVADGLGTGEIADKLSYSERTVKNVLHDVTTRFSLRNRSHAVAYALRAGVI